MEWNIGPSFRILLTDLLAISDLPSIVVSLSMLVKRLQQFAPFATA
jgi:hypothetical protein